MAGATQEVAGARGLDDAERQVHDGAHQRLAHLGEDPFSEDSGEVLPDAGLQRVGGGQGDDDDDEAAQPPRPAVRVGSIHHEAEDPGDGRRGEGGGQLDDGEGSDGTPVLAQEHAEAPAHVGGIGHGEAQGAHARSPPRSTTAA